LETCHRLPWTDTARHDGDEDAAYVDAGFVAERRSLLLDPLAKTYLRAIAAAGTHNEKYPKQ
jgi:hypothetical protein